MNEIVPVSRPTHLAETRSETQFDQVAALLAPLFALFAVEVELQRIYIRHLMDIPADKLAKAIDTAIKTLRFRPAVAEIRELAQNYTTPGPRNDLTPEQIAALPDKTNKRMYRDPRDTDTPEGRRWRATRLAGTRRDDRGN